MTDTANRVKKIVAEHLGVEESKVTDTASFIDDLGADSLDTVELVMAFEEEFVKFLMKLLRKFLLLKTLSTIFLRMLSLFRLEELMKLA